MRAGQKWNRHYWLRDWPGFLDFFFRECFTEPHSTKQIEDAIGWGLETDPQTVVRGTGRGVVQRRRVPPARAVRAGCGARCWSSRATEDADRRASPRARGRGRPRPRPSWYCWRAPGTARTCATRSATNLIIRDFACPPAPPRRWRRGRSRPQRALYISLADRARSRAARHRDRRPSCASCSPAWRSTGSPRTRSPAVLAASGERIHPASAELASESGHIESESAEHDLHCFQAWRRMDEILVANFMVFHDLIRGRAVRPVDRRRGLGARLLPAREPGAEDRGLRVAHRLRRLAADARRRRPAEAALTADYNAEMIEHIARFPRRARPGDLRRRARTTSCRTRSGLTFRRSGPGPSRITTSPGTSPGSTRRIAGRPWSDWATGRTSGSASSPSAARASAGTCCAG